MVGSSGAFSGVSLALLAALLWGGGDFAGGMGVRSAGGTTRAALRVILTAHGISLIALLFGFALVVEPRWQGWPAAWGLLAGVVAGLAIAAFYVALARGSMGLAAALSGLLAAAIPAAVGMLLEGRPRSLQLAGFALAAGAIWLIAAPGSAVTAGAAAPGTFGLAVLGGVGFGLYFTALKLANPLGVLAPLTLARIGSLAAAGTLLLLLRRPHAGEAEPQQWLPRAGWLWALGVAVMDSGGNLLFIAATRAGRLDIAAVLASLYPASTILLAAGVLGERPGRRQLIGMAIAAAAVVLVTLSPGH